MIHAYHEKVSHYIPASVATNGTGTLVVDRLNYDFVTIDVNVGTASSNIATLKVAESDTTDATNYSDITAFTGGTSAGNFTIPTADTSNAVSVQFQIDCKARKRYLKCSITPGVAGVVSMIGRARRAKISPAMTAAGMGPTTLVVG